ncbi:MAG: ABC transporter permease [Lachnospiraceae bacterium]|nr:ABC transporter permease [Candidatus Colinaster scatohippi]
MGQIIEYISIAIMNIKNNRGRSVLTMLGIIIGISSVILVISIGNGVRDEINGELEGMAGGQVIMYVDTTRKDTTVQYDYSDIEYLNDRLDNIKGVSPACNLWGTAVGPKVARDINITAGTPALQYNSSQPIIKGRYFTDAEYEAGSLVCVINESDAEQLFGSTDVVGLTFEATIWGISQDLKVVGVRKNANQSLINMLGGSDYISADIPYSTAGYKFDEYTDYFTQITIYANSSEYCNEVASKAKSLLEAKYHCEGENQIMFESFSDYSSQFDSILGAITVFVSLVAAISLIVGGIGVMNIMLVSVTERTREIGIRKSLGARTKSIMWQFLAEAGIITLIGGIIGIILGSAGAFLVCAIIGIKATISISTVLIASVFSCSVGIFFGIYPAKKAAKLSPIDALRHV